MTRFLLAFLILALAAPDLQAQNDGAFSLARIKYRGGGDWYNNPSSLKNLISFTRENAPLTIQSDYDDVSLGSQDLYQYPFAFMTGHGNISINEAEARNLRNYLDNGGFLYVDDDYGLDEHFRNMIQQVYPDEELVEVPFSHPIYHQLYDFPDGLPKIHKHDGKPPQGFAIFREGRMVLFYTYETNLSDGWANPDVHNDPPEVREKALQMGGNILIYALTNHR